MKLLVALLVIILVAPVYAANEVDLRNSETIKTTDEWFMGLNLDVFVYSNVTGAEAFAPGRVNDLYWQRQWNSSVFSMARTNLRNNLVGTDNIYDSGLHENVHGQALYLGPQNTVFEWVIEGSAEGNRNTSASCGGNPSYCPPNNYTNWSLTTYNGWVNFTNNGSLVPGSRSRLDPWNEGYGTATGPSGIARDHITRCGWFVPAMLEANTRFNGSFDAIYTPSVANDVNNYMACIFGNMTSNMLPNAHLYSDYDAGQDGYDWMYTAATNVYDRCVAAGGYNCGLINVGEWGDDSEALKCNQNSTLRVQYAGNLMALMAHPRVAGTGLYTIKGYETIASTCPSTSSQVWGVAEEYQNLTQWNITERIGRVCGLNGTAIKGGSSTDSDLEIVSCTQSNNDSYFIVLNRGAAASKLIDITGDNTVTNVTNILNGTTHTVSTGKVNVLLAAEDVTIFSVNFSSFESGGGGDGAPLPAMVGGRFIIVNGQVLII